MFPNGFRPVFVYFSHNYHEKKWILTLGVRGLKLTKISHFKGGF